MKRWLSAVLALLLLLAAGAAAADGAPVPATPTDLECPHEHTKETVFYDSTIYIRATAEQHRVIGTNAVIRTVCLDCGEVISEERRDQVEELRPHAFKGGRCFFCGEPEPENGEDGAPPKEYVIALLPAGEGAETGAAESLSVTVDAEYLAALEADGTELLIIRPEGCPAALVLPVSALRGELEAKQASLRADIRSAEGGAVYASLSQETAEGARADLSEAEGIRIRFYPESEANSTAAFIPAAAPDVLPEVSFDPLTGAVADGEFLAAERTEAPDPVGVCWEVPYRGPGLYLP